MHESSAGDTLVQLLRDKEHAVRAACAAALGRIGDRAVVPALISVLKDDQWNVRHAAVEALGRLKDERAVEPLLAVLKDLDKDVRIAAVQTLTQLNDLRSVKALVETLTDSQSEIRRAAAGALQVIKPDWPQSESARQAMPVLKAAQQNQDYWVRHAATETLAKINQTPLAAPELASLGESSHFRRKSASDMLIELLGDYDRDLRVASVEALARIGDYRAITPLVATLKDEDVWVREAAIRALDKLGWQPGAKVPA
jgi:HEAT repeat protein